MALGPSEPRPASPSRERNPAENPEDVGGPPEDAVTSYEDLPADLFGEPDDAPAAPRPRGEAADPSASRAAGTSSAATADAGDSDIDRRSPIAMVQSLFPGRIVAVEPLAGADDETADAEGADAPSDPDDVDANDPDDGPPPASG